MSVINILLKLKNVAGTILNPATSEKQDTTNTALGAPADTAATTDTGTFSLIALFKRALTNWTTLLARLPASLGQKSSALSLATVLSAEQEALFANFLGRLKVSDRLTGFEALADQAGAGAVLTFTFAAAPDLVWVRSVGGISRADPSGGAPTATLGVYCAADEPNPISFSGSTTLKVFAPAGAVVSVWGYRYT